MGLNSLPVDYSVIIPAYNEELLLPRTLHFLKRAMHAVSLKGEIIVVDNNSTDNTPHVAKKEGARVIKEPVNQIARARNTGAREANGRFLLFLDADTMPSSELVHAALKQLEQGAIGGGAYIELERGSTKKLFYGLVQLFSWALMKCGICGGSFIFCDRQAFVEIGGFDERVYAGEDVLISIALKKRGRKTKRPFTMLRRPSILSSDRKMNAYSPIYLLSTFAMFALFPWAVRFKYFCRMWYRRTEP